MKDVKWRVISPAKHFDPKVVAEVLRGQVDMLVAGRQYTIDGSVVEIGSIGSLSHMGIQLVPEVDKPTIAPQPEPSPAANIPETPDSSVADHVPGVTKMVTDGPTKTQKTQHDDETDFVNMQDKTPESSLDHSADASKMVEPKIVARYDTEGRDVTELPGLWSEDDIQYRELTEDDRKNLPTKCEVRGSRGPEWFKAKLVRICENPTHPYIAETDHGRVVHAAHCRIKVAPTVKESLTVDTPDPAKITIGYTVPNAYQADAEPITKPIDRKRVLYIAGPMRGIAFFNYPMFDRVAKNLREAGNEVISPADEDRKQDGFDPFANPEYRIPDACVFPHEMDFGKTVRRCLDAVLRCDEIVLLPGWEGSNGAVAELTLAMWLGKRVRQVRIDEEDRITYLGQWMGLGNLALLLRNYYFSGVESPVVVNDQDDDDEDILDTAARITRGDRNASYGPPDQDFRRTAGMWSALFGAKLKDGVTFEPRDVAMAMILLKCSRESHQRKLDNWVDIAGYARCGSKCN